MSPPAGQPRTGVWLQASYTRTAAHAGAVLAVRGTGGGRAGQARRGHDVEDRAATVTGGGDPLLLRIPDAAARLGIGRSKLYELLRGREIAAVRIGRCVRVPLSELEAWVAARVAAARDGGAPP